MLTFHILTLFPAIFKGVFDESILARAQKKGLIVIKLYNLRDWGIGKHKQVDDTPYGGGAGMVIRVDVVSHALADIKKRLQQVSIQSGRYNKRSDATIKTILLTPQGKPYNQKAAKSFTKYSDLILICGRYEGFDERVSGLVDEEISIGDYVLSGGEIPAMVLTETISRLLPKVLGKEESVKTESFEKGLLKYPQYTRPENFDILKEGKKSGLRVPEVLLSGDHKKIEIWRKEEAIKKTKKKRPDLLR